MHALGAGTVKAVVTPRPQKGGPEGRSEDGTGKWRAGVEGQIVWIIGG